MNVAGAFNATHRNLKFGSCAVWLCLRKDTEDNNQISNLCK